MKQETKSTLILISVTAIWGMTFVLIQGAVSYINPIDFVSVRMILASVFFLPFIYKQFGKSTLWILGGGFILAILNAITYILQTEGLQTIPASRSAFITGTCVVIVPILAPLFKLGWPKKIEIAASLICVLGLYILTGANLAKLSIGDLWSLGCAFTYAIMVLVLQIVSKKSKENLLLSFYMVAFGILPAMLFAPTFNWHSLINGHVLIALLFCSLLATTVVTYFMVTHQKHITVTKAAVVYSLEPVFATLFAVLITGQILTINLLIGGILILSSILLPNIKRRNQKMSLPPLAGEG